MKNYHTATQEDYNALMIELENKGCMWYEEKPTAKNYWPKNEEKTYVMEENGYLTYGRMEPSYRELYSKEPFIDYKAKGENMLNTECKQCHKKWHHDNAKYCEMCGNKLVDEPEFKVGDYVIKQNGNIISKIGEVLNGDFFGPYYKKIDNYFANLGGNILVKDIERHATPEEILEYESALSFHKHGRKPFEVMVDDIIRDSEGKKRYVAIPGRWRKEQFTRHGCTLLATAEEVNEWLGADDERLNSSKEKA